MPKYPPPSNTRQKDIKAFYTGRPEETNAVNLLNVSIMPNKSAHSWVINNSVYYCLKRSKELLGAPVQVSTSKALKPSAWRRWALELLVSKETFVSPIKSWNLRLETLTLIRSLVMKKSKQTIVVLSRFRGPQKRAAWLRTAIWIVVVFSVALGRNIVRGVCMWKGRDSFGVNHQLA